MLKVTFDTNIFNEIGTSECSDDDPVVKALRESQIRGFFSDAVLALDALAKQDKVDVVGSSRIKSKSHSTAPHSITISVGMKHESAEINPQFLQKIDRILNLGMQAMIGPRRLGDGLPRHGFGYKIYAPHASHHELMFRGEKANEVDHALAVRGLGRARVVALGLEFSKRDGFEGEYRCQGIERARDDAERKRVRKAINEWADGEAMAAHIGYGNDLFCTHDLGKSAGGKSVFDDENRNWLKEQYGVEFVTKSELEERLSEVKNYQV